MTSEIRNSHQSRRLSIIYLSLPPPPFPYLTQSSPSNPLILPPPHRIPSLPPTHTPSVLPPTSHPPTHHFTPIYSPIPHYLSAHPTHLPNHPPNHARRRGPREGGKPYPNQYVARVTSPARVGGQRGGGGDLRSFRFLPPSDRAICSARFPA